MKLQWFTTLGTLTVGASLFLGSSSASAQAPKAEKPIPKVDPQATALLSKSKAYLESLPAFRVQATTTYDKIVGDNYKLQKSENVDLVLSKPGRIRADIVGDERNQLLVDDGKKLTIYSRPEKYFATMTALPTIRETIDVASDRYGVEFPLLDLVFMAHGEDLGKNVTAAGVIGSGPCGKATCEQLAFRGKLLDWQVWIENGDKPVPHKIVLTTRDKPGQPQYTANLEWDVAPKIDDNTFAFTAPQGAAEMALPKPQGGAK
ncbi:MAG: DUF2092 domain-containing protein [Polyangiales bacterium]